MTILKLAWRNLMGAGIRTWLNVLVLSLSFVVIIWARGFLEGMNRQAQDSMIAAEYAGGQYWLEKYDPYDPFSLADAHAGLPPAIAEIVRSGDATPVLVTQGSIYSGGSMRPVLLKGVEPGQVIVSLPSGFIAQDSGAAELPALIGSRMARNTGLKQGDIVTIQWRDAHGTFDAREARVVQVMSTSVQSIDVGQVWLPLDQLRAMADMPGQATFVILKRGTHPLPAPAGWVFHSTDDLMSDLRALVKAKSTSSSLFYMILMFLAMLAIFDTQVLSLFRRRKEMGTLMALGMTRGRVIELFTLEGALHGLLAGLVGAVYGIPFLAYMARQGIQMPKMLDSMGFAIGERLYSTYTPGLVLGTTVLILVVTTVVSFLPTRRIAKLKPTDALRGRWT
jgi:ABC-type lipoprotein release transport system permease subunit